MEFTVSCESKLFYKDAHGNRWPYLPVKELHKRYPNGGYRIVADLKNSKGAPNLKLSHGTQTLAVHSYRRKLGFCEKTVGYIQVTDPENGGDAFVRIVKPSYEKLLLLLLLLLVATGIILIVVFRPNSTEEVPGLDKAAFAYNIEGMENTDPSQIALPGITEIKAKAGQTSVQYALINPKGNPCYLTYIITLDETGEVLYESGMVEPGKAVRDLTLSRALAAGDYPITVEARSNDINDYTVELNSGSIKATLKVEA